MIENLHTAASTWEQNIKFQIKFQILKIIKKNYWKCNKYDKTSCESREKEMHNVVR